jgi:hypothetical protein
VCTLVSETEVHKLSSCLMCGVRHRMVMNSDCMGRHMVEGTSNGDCGKK